jgi:hypothetical protein
VLVHQLGHYNPVDPSCLRLRTNGNLKVRMKVGRVISIRVKSKARKNMTQPYIRLQISLSWSKHKSRK